MRNFIGVAIVLETWDILLYACFEPVNPFTLTIEVGHIIYIIFFKQALIRMNGQSRCDILFWFTMASIADFTKYIYFFSPGRDASNNLSHECRSVSLLYVHHPAV